MSLSPAHTTNHPFLASESPADEDRFLGSLKLRVTTAWRRHRYRRIQQAIRTYSSEKHFLSPVFRPVAGPATMRAANREIERNKLPFNPESGRPWLANAHATAPLQLADTSDTTSNVSELPASLRDLRQSSPSRAEEPSDESPIILIT